MATLLLENMAVAGAGKAGGRARKGKNAQKKQPQRGLGVAQLEKLRLQEQSKQEAACYASMAATLPPSFAAFGTAGVSSLPHYVSGKQSDEALRSYVSLAASSDHRAGSFRVMVPRDFGGASPGPGSCSAVVVEKKRQPCCPSSSSLFSNGVTTLGDSLAVSNAVEPGGLSEADRESVHLFHGGDNAGVAAAAAAADAKLFPVGAGKNSNGAGSLFSSTSLQCFESSSGSAKLQRRLPQDRAELPVVVGLAVNCGRPKELSSFQSFSSNNTWSGTEKICGQKRPWYDLKVNTSKLMHSESLDLNAPAGEVEVAQSGGGVAQGHESPVEVHHTLGITRSGLGNTLPLLKAASWQENEVQNLSTTTDVGFHSADSFLKVSCPPRSKIKDCCSSVCSPCGSPVTRQRCVSSPEVPVLLGVDNETSGDFLTLGMSSRSYPTSPQFGVEVDSKESMSPEVAHQAKRFRNSRAEVDDTLQLQMSNRHQESAPSVTGGVYSPSCTETSFLSAMGLSCRFTSTSSSNMTEDCHNQSGREERQEFIDLRLKLAL